MNNSKPYHILIISKESNYKFIAQSLLNFQNHEVDIALNQSQTDYSLKNYKYDLIIADVSYLKPDFLDKLDLMRSVPKNIVTPMIGVVCNSNYLNVERLINSGFDDIVIKPHTRVAYAMMLQKWCQSSQKAA